MVDNDLRVPKIRTATLCATGLQVQGCVGLSAAAVTMAPRKREGRDRETRDPALEAEERYYEQLALQQLQQRRRNSPVYCLRLMFAETFSFLKSYLELNFENLISWIVFVLLGWTLVERSLMRPSVHYDPNSPSAGELSLASLGLKALTDDVFSGMQGLLMLKLNNNLLSTIPKDVFKDLISLHTLHLGSNKITSLLPRAFSKLQSLQSLDLGSNLLAKIPASVFKGLFNLRRLILSGNKLKTVPPGVFNELTHLEQLHLNSNNIETLPHDVFIGLNNLKELYLQDNNISALPPALFSDLTQLQVLSFPSRVPPLSSHALQGCCRELFHPFSLGTSSLGPITSTSTSEQNSRVCTECAELCVHPSASHSQQHLHLHSATSFRVSIWNGIG